MTSEAALLESDTCWICGSSTLRLVHEGNLPETVDETAFRITDLDYGSTADIYKCDSCGFLQCSRLTDVLRFYESMDDDTYEATRGQRAQQSRRLLRILAKHRPAGRLLDVGAGSGILVQEALAMGYVAEGVEPSVKLQAQAEAYDLPVHAGVLGQAEVTGPFDLACLVDVIEHVPDPVGLLAQINDTLGQDGLLMVVTPDVGSVAARLLGWKWWHFRIAHIGYFNRATLADALHRAGFEILSVTRPSWYFPASYLVERVQVYLPPVLRFRPPRFLSSVTVPLNLFDSFCVVCRKSRSPR